MYNFSLYPSVLKYGKFPVGHPEVIIENFQSLDQYFGIAKVKVLPPRKLYHPVLPYTSGGKLKFPLCRTCADREKYPCHCTDDQRALVGTWCTPELSKAVEKGYKILKMYEVYHWSKTSQHGDATNGLFTSYVDTFLKIKQESSGWPEWCDTDEKKRQYLDNYKCHEGIDLDPTKIKFNPGRRSSSKLNLNVSGVPLVRKSY